MVFNEKLQQLRKSRGMTQEELAEMLDITRQTISKWECGESTPDLVYLPKISDIFGVTTDYLLKDNVERENASSSETSPDAASGMSAANQSKGTPEAAPDRQSKISAVEVPLVVLEKRKLNDKSLLGICLTCTSFMITLIFVILSRTNPTEVLNEFGNFDGLFGFLFCHRLIWLFVLDCLAFAAGLVLLILPVILSSVKKEK